MSGDNKINTFASPGIQIHMTRILRHITVLLLLVGVVPGASGQINTDQVMRIGRNSLYFEDYILSIQYFNQVIKIKPFLAEPYFYRSVAKINLEDYNGAEQDASLALDRNPFIIDAYQVRAVARQNMRNYNGAIEDYESALKLNPEEKTFLVNRAVCLTEVKRYAEADSAFRRVMSMDSKSDKPVLGLAHMYLMTGDTVKALEYINKSIEMSTKNAMAYVLKAEILMRGQNKDYEGALAAMDEAITLEPRNASFFINRAYVKYNLDDYFGTMADYDYAISLEPTSVEAHFNRGLLRAEVGDNNKAIEDFDYVIKARPEDFMAHYNRAMLYYRTGQYRNAVSDYDVILKKYPQFEAGYMARGETKRRMGDRKGGDADYDHALSIFKSKKTRVSNFNPIEIEHAAAVKKAEMRRENNEPESEEEIMNKFNTLLTVAPENPNKPEYANRQRGRIQNTNVEIEPEPMFILTYYAHDNKLNGNTYYVKEIAELNETRLLPGTLSLAAGDVSIDEEAISLRFASIEYYNSTLASPRPRAIDYFARGVDHLLVRNPEAAINDATLALYVNKDFAMAYFLRANARLLKYRMTDAAADADQHTNDAQAQAMLHQHQLSAAMQEIIADLDEVIKLAPRNVYALFNKGNAYMTMNDYTSAISCYTRALEIKPDLAAAYYNRGLMYLRMGNKDLGVADLSKAGELGILPSYNVLKRMTN